MSDSTTATNPKYLPLLFHLLVVLTFIEVQFLPWLFSTVLNPLSVMSNFHSKRKRDQKQEKLHHNQPPANAPSPTPSSASTITDLRPQGNRKNRSNDDGTVAGTAPKAVNSVPTGDLVLPGVTPDQDEDTSLKIKVHLNLHAKVRVDVDAQLYGDIIIGLL